MTLPNRPPGGSPTRVGARGTTASASEPPFLSLAAHFELHIDGVQLSCASVSAPELAADASQIQRRESGGVRAGVLWTAPSIPSRLVITRALDGDRTLYEWRREAISGKAAVRTIEIKHLERAGAEPLHIWRAVHTWPLRWTGPHYDALHGGIAVEALELVYDDLLWLSAQS